MPAIQWTDKLSIGVHEIDEQHQKLVNMVNRLEEVMREGRGKEVMDKVIGNMITYTRTHFHTEESYFDQFGYTETESHKHEHSQFANKVDEFYKDFQSGKLGLSVNVLNFLSNWLTNHIMGTDQKYAACFKSHGL